MDERLDEIRKKIESVIKKYPIEICWIFGSQATGKTGPLSDYDFAVYVNDKKYPGIDKKHSWGFQATLISEFGSVLKTNDVDVVIMNDPKATLFLKYSVISGKVLYCRNEKLRSGFEYEVMRDYLDRFYYEEMLADYYLRKAAGAIV